MTLICELFKLTCKLILNLLIFKEVELSSGTLRIDFLALLPLSIGMARSCLSIPKIILICFSTCAALSVESCQNAGKSNDNNLCVNHITNIYSLLDYNTKNSRIVMEFGTYRMKLQKREQLSVSCA